MTKKDDPPKSSTEPKPTGFQSARETIDSIVVAFILAFLFRTFEAEAFVIPTGSMALTLMGAHKEVTCPECGIKYKVGASSENPDDGRKPQKVTSSTCPNCRFHYEFRKETPPTYNGDRILVTKYSYQFSEPERYDVVVFKNPSQAKQNYIKRLIGLPNEEILIYRGDIYYRKPNESSFHIARKDHDRARTVMQLVYDNDHIAPTEKKVNWPRRWFEMSAPNALGAASTPQKWRVSDDGATFKTADDYAGDAVLAYRHLVPNRSDWSHMRNAAEDNLPFAVGDIPSPQLITDFCEYNTGGDGSTGEHWVGDIAMECELQFLPSDAGDGSAGEAVLQLVEGGRIFQCRIARATGDITLEGLGDGFPPVIAANACSGSGPHTVRFANIDDRLLVWVDDKPVKFNHEPIYLAAATAPLYSEVTGFQYGAIFSPPEARDAFEFGIDGSTGELSVAAPAGDAGRELARNTDQGLENYKLRLQHDGRRLSVFKNERPLSMDGSLEFASEPFDREYFVKFAPFTAYRRYRKERIPEDRILELQQQGLVKVFDAPEQIASGNPDIQTAISGRLVDVYSVVSADLDGGLSNPPLDNSHPTQEDLNAPVRIIARNAALHVSHLRVLRDQYYIADKRRLVGVYPFNDGSDFEGTSDHRNANVVTSEAEMREVMSNVNDRRFDELVAVSFPLQDDQFFVLGDNSQQSLDGRLWPSSEQFVKRELLIGKALFVYWPHAVNVPGTSFNWFPNFGQMRRIR